MKKLICWILRKLGFIKKCKIDGTAWIPAAGVPLEGDPRREVTEESVCFLGDSLTHIGWWRGWFPEWVTANQGWGGDMTFNVLKRLGKITKKKPKVIILLIGGNDVAQGIHPMIIVSKIFEIMDRIRTETPNTKLFVQSVFPFGECAREKFKGLPKDFNKRIDTVNEFLTLICVKEGIPLIPTSTAVMRDHKGNLKEEYTSDLIHMSEAGYGALVGFLRMYLIDEGRL